MSHRIGVLVRLERELTGQTIAESGATGTVVQWPPNECDERHAQMSYVRFGNNPPFLVPDTHLAECFPGEPAWKNLPKEEETPPAEKDVPPVMEENFVFLEEVDRRDD